MDTAAAPLTIGQVAKQAGVGVETIRFYEREGLIDQPQRRTSGYRQYGPAIVQRIRFIQHAKGLGFTLQEVSELLSLRASPDGTCAAVRDHALARVDDIDAKISALRKIRRALVRLSETCEGGRPASECPILESLNQENDVASD